MKSKFMRIGITVILGISVIATGIFFYNNAEAVIVYEYNKQVKDDSELAENIQNNFESIPVFPEYTLKLNNENLYVFADNKTVYVMENINTSKLSSTDITLLERDGIKFASRSEVIEMLYYFNS